LATIPGIGPIIATALTASVTDPAVFKSGRELAARDAAWCRDRTRPAARSAWDGSRNKEIRGSKPRGVPTFRAALETDAISHSTKSLRDISLARDSGELITGEDFIDNIAGARF
jgi:hypothetical protein